MFDLIYFENKELVGYIALAQSDLLFLRFKRSIASFKPPVTLHFA